MSCKKKCVPIGIMGGGGGGTPIPSNTDGANGQLVVTIPAGTSDGTQTTTANDTNLVASNIVSGVTLFGVPGTAEILTPGTCIFGRQFGVLGPSVNPSGVSKTWEDEFDLVVSSQGFCASIKNGILYTWGLNSNGRTGQGTTTGDTLIPTQIGVDTDWEYVSLGDAHGAAIKSDGTLWTWGFNSNGRTGQGTTAGNTLSPTQIGSDTDWEYVSCGDNFTLAIKGGKILSCGNNINGKLGQGLAASAATNITTFTELNGGSTGWTDVQCGILYFIAIKDGNIWGAGSGANGRIGNNGTSNYITVFNSVSTGDYSKVYAGSDASFGIKTNGTLRGFGNQNNGRIGNGGSGNQLTPVQIGSDTDWQELSMCLNSFSTSLAFYAVAKKGNKLWVTGNNQINQLGILDDTSTVSSRTKLSDVSIKQLSNRTYGSTLFTI